MHEKIKRKKMVLALAKRIIDPEDTTKRSIPEYKEIIRFLIEDLPRKTRGVETTPDLWDAFVEWACAAGGIAENEFYSESRGEDPIATVRHTVIWAWVHATGEGWSAIGRRLYRDHSSVIHGFRSIDSTMYPAVRIARETYLNAVFTLHEQISGKDEEE
jgi:chromosomal replication initiation ATPase DnaA